METYYKAINWNEIEDAIDKSTWEKLTEQFWLDTRIPLSNDLDDWRKLSAEEKDLVGKVFGGLTLLDTMQSQTGVEAIRADVRTPHEEAVLNNIQFMESVHAKSYSSIFSTLNTKSEIEEIFEWTNSNEYLQTKAKIINDIYENGTPLQKKVASTYLETFLFYSGFFTPLYYLGNNKLANVAESSSSLSVTNLFTEPISATSSNLDLTNYQKKNKRNSKNGCMIFSTPSMRMKKATQRASMTEWAGQRKSKPSFATMPIKPS